ncbi:MAG TPA: pitrilysin family protein [Vicinamibacterales bacterium]|nr:pitrilysin family protein [Vicinamibacterales bacterium]
MSSLLRRTPAALLAAAFLVVSAGAATQPALKFTDTRLKNGLRVIVNEDHVAPVFAVAVVYDVGSRNERPGRTGFAHLFEHMMFKGSGNVGPGEHFYTVFSSGGVMNGTTSKERTLYFEELPSNQLDMALFLEADRMRSLAITRANLDNQRQAVEEERRQSLDNQAYARTREAFDDLAFDNAAYKHSVIGSMEDLNAASVDDVASFFKTYYAPNNAILSISGDVNTAAAMEKVHKYFDAIPSQPAPPAVDITQDPQTTERRLTVEDPLARLPRLDVGYRIPSSLSPDDDAFDVLVQVLSGGRSSRLYESLVRDQQIAVQVTAGTEESRGPRLFRIIAAPTPGRTIEDLEAALYAEIERVKEGPIADWEIEKARNAGRRQIVGEATRSLQRAVLLAEAALVYGDPAIVNTRFDRLAKFNAADVQRVAKQFLVATNRTVIVTQPKKSAAPKGGAR